MEKNDIEKKDKKKKIEKVGEKENINEVDNSTFRKIYVGYSTRVIICLTLFIISLVLGVCCVYRSLNFIEPEYINYDEKSNLDYKVYLKENDFYDEKSLGKDMLYVANLIDKIKVDFRYSFLSNKNVSLDFNYDIVAKLVISNSDGKKTYYTKKYTLLDDKSLSLKDGILMNINESIDIDYDYYNKIANKFKTTYGLDATSKLLVYLEVNKNNNSNMNQNSQMLVNIPLSEKAIEIKLDYKKIDSSSTLINESSIMINDIIYMVVAGILFIVSIISFIKLLRLLLMLKDNRSNYDKYIKKILNEYDRLIVETTTSPFINNGNIVDIDKFSELLDVRDNLKLPIMYYSIAKHHKCCFYITYKDKIYMYNVKSVDFENYK